ncbi:MAG: LysR family transcriptional regulator [Maritimibacter sp.]|nr:LysR family transcriptional regulator [Maritimibacter sp.]
MFAFVAICEEGSITGAARRLGVAQPALSSSVRRLETDFGQTLLRRLPRGVAPTEAGQILLRQAYEFISLAQETQRALEHVDDEPTGEVSIGLPPSAAAVLTFPLLTSLAARFPRVSIRFVEALSGYLLGWVNAGELDLAMVFDAQNTSTIMSRAVLKEDLVLIGRTDLMAQLPSPYPLADISQLPLITSSARHGLRQTLTQYLESIGLELKIKFEIDAGYQLVKMVTSGEGFGFFAMSAFSEELAAGKVASLPTEPRFSRKACIIRRVEGKRDKAISLVADHIEEQVYSLCRAGIWKADILKTSA